MTGSDAASAASIVHLVFSTVAFLSGTAVMLLTKGTLWHRRLGRVFALSMLVVCATAFGIRNLTGTYTFNHALAAMTFALAGAGLGMASFRWPRRKWPAYHSVMLLWAYVALLGFGASQVASRIPGVPQAIALGTLPLAIVAVGAVWIHTARGQLAARRRGQ